MAANTECPACGSALPPQEVYDGGQCPAFQNKVYDDAQTARGAALARVRLLWCPACGFVFNGAFDPSLMAYDANYQNEQAHSPAFQAHLSAILGLLEANFPRFTRVVEVGCGKGAFLARLSEAGFDVCGFDPAYEGSDERIRKEYFRPGIGMAPAGLVVLRHTLEHVPGPRDFLRAIAQANGNQGRIYIEVPCFEWIMAKRAFWDVFHEHCNYFTPATLAGLFTRAQVGHVFGGQYLYALADLGSLAGSDAPAPPLAPPALPFAAEAERLREFVRRHPGMLVWGAAAKGTSFLNMADAEARHVAAAVDINPRKQGRFVGGTGHKIIAPAELGPFSGRHVLVMNENYADEVRAAVAGLNMRVSTLGDMAGL